MIASRMLIMLGTLTCLSMIRIRARLSCPGYRAESVHTPKQREEHRGIATCTT